MLPWGHAAVGYLLYVGFVRYRGGENATPLAAPVLALAVGTQFADLIDKPLGWYLGVLPSGRSLGHSLLVAIVIIGAVHWLAIQYDRRELSIAFAIGHLSHLAGDALYPVLFGRWADLRFLLWPVLPQPDADTDRTIIETLVNSTLSGPGLFESILFVAVTLLWIRHGAPGLRLLFDRTVTVSRRLTP